MNSPREIALQILQSTLEGSAFAALPQTLQTKSDNDDNAFITMLVLTSLRHLVYIRKILKKLITQKLSRQNPLAQYALFLGATELLYMHTPDYAVIDSYVTIIKTRTNRYIGGFVNAVLRRISLSKNEFISADKGEFFPQSFRTILRHSYSAKTIAAIEKASQLEPCLDITSISPSFFADGTILPLGTIRLFHKGKISSLPGYSKGTWWVQDFSASLPVKMLGDIAGKKVLDLCAAPGGKTAQLLCGKALVSCLDISHERLAILKENLARLHLKPQQIICQDGPSFLEQSSQQFDIVLLDAPCSATGTLRRHPEIVHTKTADDIAKQSALQKRFLDTVDRVIAPQGLLLYCTCSLCHEEGEEQIAYFLRNNPTYQIVNLQPQIPANLSEIVTSEGFIRILPQHLLSFGGADGFFIACLKKGK